MKYAICEKANDLWAPSERGTIITANRTPVISKSSKVFTMGSCFAYEIRKALRASGLSVFPDWDKLKLNREVQIVARLPKDDAIAHYDTFVILQEIRDALFGVDLKDDEFLELDGPSPIAAHFAASKAWQDPYRKQMYGKSIEDLKDISQQFTRCVRDGLEQSDAYVITLGLIETWRNPKNGRYFCRPPGTGSNGGLGQKAAEFYLSTFDDNLRNVREIIDLIQKHYPGRPIILSVSPVILEKTYTEDDVIVANTYSKSILRAVVGQIMHERKDSGIYYMPSYEIAQRVDIFEQDGRHVTEKAAQFIVSMFKHTFMTD